MSRWTGNEDPVAGSQGYPRDEFRAYATWRTPHGQHEAAQRWTKTRSEIGPLLRELRDRYADRDGYVLCADHYHWPQKGSPPDIKAIEIKNGGFGGEREVLSNDEKLAKLGGLRDAMRLRHPSDDPLAKGDHT